MSLLKWIFGAAKRVKCTHVYCYRSRECTQCGHYCTGPEPEYTPHFVVDGKLVQESEASARG